MKWFQNIACGEHFGAKKSFQTDFSLQLSSALQNYFTWRDAGSKINAERYNQKYKNTQDRVFEVRQVEIK